MSRKIPCLAAHKWDGDFGITAVQSTTHPSPPGVRLQCSSSPQEPVATLLLRDSASVFDGAHQNFLVFPHPECLLHHLCVAAAAQPCNWSLTLHLHADFIPHQGNDQLHAPAPVASHVVLPPCPSSLSHCSHDSSVSLHTFGSSLPHHSPAADFTTFGISPCCLL